MSHLLQMRGLKLVMDMWGNWMSLSHLLQMRGLKRLFGLTYKRCKSVASFTDAWIETNIPTNSLKETGLVASFTDAWIETMNKVFVLLLVACRIFYRCVD